MSTPWSVAGKGSPTPSRSEQSFCYLPTVWTCWAHIVCVPQRRWTHRVCASTDMSNGAGPFHVKKASQSQAALELTLTPDVSAAAGSGTASTCCTTTQLRARRRRQCRSTCRRLLWARSSTSSGGRPSRCHSCAWRGCIELFLYFVLRMQIATASDSAAEQCILPPETLSHLVL